MKRSIFTFGCLLLASQALAQAPSPAQMGITPTTTPEVLQTLDNTKTWVPLGTVDPTTHTFTPVGGGGGGGGALTPIPSDTVLGNATGAAAIPQALSLPSCASLSSALTYTLGSGFGCNLIATGGGGGGGVSNAFNGIVNVTDVAVGMVANTSQDNSLNVPALNSALGPASGAGYEVIIPGILGQFYTNYYFGAPFHTARQARYRCVAPLNGSVYLWFAPGVDGVIQDQRSSFENCIIGSTGLGTFWGNAFNNVVFSITPYGGFGSPPPFVWHVGDGFMVTPEGPTVFPVDAFPAYPPGTTVTAIHGGAITGYIAGRALTITSGDTSIGATLSGGGVAAGTVVIDGTSPNYTVSITQTLGSSGAPASMSANTSLTLSNPANPYLAGSVASMTLPQVAGQPAPFPNNGVAPARGVATFTQTSNNNFNNNDTISVAGTTYTFVTAAVGLQHSVAIGLNFDASAANLVAAVMNTAGQGAIYSPSSAGRDFNSPHPFITAAHVPGSGVITFTSRYSGATVAAFSSTYTTGGTAAGAFGAAAFVGADTLATCPSPCLYETAGPLMFQQLPASLAYHATTVAGSFRMAWAQPALPKEPLYNGDKIWSDAFPFGSTMGQVVSAALFVEAGTNNFQNGDTLHVGNNTFTFRTALTAAAGDVKIGVDFPTSLANLSEGIQNSPAVDRGVIFNPPTNVSNVSIVGTQGPTWATFYATTLAAANTFPAVYTSAGASAGTFTTGADFTQYTEDTVSQSGAGNQLATQTHAPGSEGLVWNIPTGLKRRTVGAALNLSLTHWGIGMSMPCSSGWGFNCDMSIDKNNWHQQDFVGRWSDGNNYASSSAKDEQFSDNYVADDIETGTLGQSIYNPNYESTESHTSLYGILMYCLSQNQTTIFGGYIGGNNMCTTPATVLPGVPSGGPTAIGLNAGTVSGAYMNGSTVCCGHPLSVLGGNDAAGFVNVGGGGGAVAPVLAYDTALGNSGTATTFGYNAANKDYQWQQGTGGNAPALKFVNSQSLDYSASGFIGLAAPPGILLGGDGFNNGLNYRLFGMSNNKPASFWHAQGDTELNIASTVGPGSMAAWYSVGGSTQLTGIISGTTLTVQQEIDPTPLPTLAIGGSGYAPGPGNLTGTLTGTLAGCTTEPVLNVTASGATGALIAITSVAAKGVCPPPVTNGATTSWTPGGALAAGAGASVNINWEQALLPQFNTPAGPPGLHQLLTGTGVVANTHIISGSGNTWTLDQTYGSPIGPETISGSSWYPAMAISNDPVNPDFTAVTLRSGSSANKDLTGRIALVSGAATFTLTGIYATAPDCVTADVTTPANANSVVESLTTLTFSGTGTDTLKWVCAGRN